MLVFVILIGMTVILMHPNPRQWRGGLMRLEPFMERVTRTGNGAEWTTGGYGYFSVTGLGAGRITDLRYQDGAKPQK